MKHILYLPSWFPSRINPYPGDFIKRHAIAASLYNKITIFFTVADSSISKDEIIYEEINKNLEIYTFYYPGSRKFLSKMVNGLKRFTALKKLYNSIFSATAPDLVHVHVAYPAGLFALYLKKNKRLKYIISEHDGIYMPGYDNYHIPGQFEKKMVPLIYKGASLVHTVSKSLGQALVNLKLSKSQPVIIPNVVDTELFTYHKPGDHSGFNFIHVSSLINQKNPEGMLEAIALVKKKRNDFKLKIIGPHVKSLEILSKKLAIEDQIVFLGEVAYNEVAKEISQSDAMIHFTRYETFGCVIAEALCSGIPVITTALDVTRELINDGENGLLVEERNIQDLADKIIFFMNSGFKINGEKVAQENKAKFNFKKVGQLFDELYTST